MRLLIIAALLSACSMKATPRLAVPLKERNIYVLSFVCGFVVTNHFIIKQ
jgi:hypothetical protein